MKTSNIILISLFGLGLIFVVVIQLFFKSVAVETKKNEFELTPGIFSKMKIESGWDVKIEKGDNSKIIFSDEIIGDLIELDGNMLTLSEIKSDSIKPYRTRILITTNLIDQITIYGNSILYYQTDFVDTLSIDLYDKSIITVRNAEIGVNQSDREKDKEVGTINFVFATLSDKSQLKIHQNINSFNAELKDSSYCGLSGKVQIDKLSKSKTAFIGMW